MAEINSVTKFFSSDLILNYFNFTQHVDEEIDKNQSLTYDAIVTTLEIFFAISMFVIISPLILVIFLAVKLGSTGPGIYTQKRVGKNGREFHIYKFRTMVQNAEQKYGPILSWQGDPRVTPFGKVLRATHLDELPQLINIIKGEMSFIGPRPERPELIKNFETEIKDYRKRDLVKPGITGMAQICCPYDATPTEKLKYDLLYILNRKSLSLNILILLFTLGKFFQGFVGEKEAIKE